MWRYRGTPFSAAPALHTARDTPRIALAPNLAVRNNNTGVKSAVRKHVITHTCRHRTQGLTFVVSAVHFDHHVVQFLLLQHVDSLKENTMCFTVLFSCFCFELIKCCTDTHRLDEGRSEGVIDVTNGFGYTFDSRTEGDMWSYGKLILSVGLGDVEEIKYRDIFGHLDISIGMIFTK